MKKIVIGLVVVAVLVVGAVVFLLGNLGSLLKDVIETAGTEVTEVNVTLNEVDVDRLTDGEAALRGLIIGNPAGFNTNSAIRLGEVSVQVDPKTVADDVIVIKKVVIAKPEITYEFGGSGSNVGTIQKNVERKTGGGKKSTGKEAKSAEDDGGKKIVIENLYIRDGSVSVSAAFLKGKEVSASLPNIHLKDIGKSKGKNTGASPAEVAQKVISAISGSATKAVGGLNIAGIKDALGKELGSATKVLEQGAGSATKKLEEGAGGVTKGLKGLLGK